MLCFHYLHELHNLVQSIVTFSLYHALNNTTLFFLFTYFTWLLSMPIGVVRFEQHILWLYSTGFECLYLALSFT